MTRADTQFRILGPLEFDGPSGPADLGSFRQKSLFALLLINANRVVSTDRILDELWRESAGERQNALWVHVSNLRSALEPTRPPRSEGSLLLTRPPGYLLKVDPEAYDAALFERLISEGRGLLLVDPAAASLVFAEALSLWRGRALEEFTYESFAQAEVSRLETLRLDAVEGRVDADLGRGLGHQLVGELEGLVREHPLRERLTAFLMTALYRSRRRADALRAYDLLRDRLRSELGVDPSEELDQMYDQVLSGDTRLEPSHRVDVTRGQGPGLAVRGYEIRAQIGTAEFGAVYRGYQPTIGREVAIKVVRPDLANDPVFVRRFEAEAGLVAGFESGHVVPVHDFWREPDAAFVVEELVTGGDLSRLLADGPSPANQVLSVVAKVAAPLSEAHRLGLAHGDVRLGKVLLDEAGNPFLTGFGLSTPPGATIEGDVVALATSAAQLFVGRPGTIDELMPLLDPAVAGVIKSASESGFDSVGALVAALQDAMGDGERAPWPGEVEAGNPYKGLEPFEEADRQDFFGRERLVERLIARLGGEGSVGRFVAVVGPSGSGKSSAVRAGLIPALRAGAVGGSDSWYVATMTPGTHPFESLERSLSKVASSIPPTLLEQMQVERSGIRRSVDAILPDETSPLILIIDQFEEIYTLTGEEERQSFVEGLVEAVGH
ncbi:MAG: BTAD domain-containing putative transcriptional regulator, partial [Acidimicrobiia bacterium]